jgi:hypothetical protein
MWRCVGLVLTDVSEEHIASIFTVEKSASENRCGQVVAGGSHLATPVRRARIFLP